MKNIYSSSKKCDKSFEFLLIIVFLSSLLPEYISPFLIPIYFLFYIVKKKKIKFDKINIFQLLLIFYMFISSIWSNTSLFTLGISFLWLNMFLIQIIINSEVDSIPKIRQVIQFFSAGACISAIIGILQIISLYLSKVFNIINLVPNPLYRYIDDFVYKILPFDTNIRYFATRASSTYCNPNIYVTLLIISFPLMLYLYKTSLKSKKIYLIGLIILFLGVLSTKSRMALLVIFLSLIIETLIFNKKEKKYTYITLVLAIIISFLVISNRLNSINILGGNSSNTHFKIWHSCLNYMFNNPLTLIFGTGSGVQNSWSILLNIYNINFPHAHNILIQLVMEIGIIGLSIFLIPFIYKIKLIRNRFNKNKILFLSLLNMLICYFILGMTDYLFNSPKQLMLLYIMFGIIESSINIYKVKEKKI